MGYYIGYAVCMSLIAVILYGIDKRRAVHHKWRIKEAALLLFGLLGGAPGAVVGMYLFHHKTKKWYFHAVNLVGMLLLIAGLIAVNLAENGALSAA